MLVGFQMVIYLQGSFTCHDQSTDWLRQNIFSDQSTCHKTENKRIPKRVWEYDQSLNFLEHCYITIAAESD